jgi:hypothetical protein
MRKYQHFERLYQPRTQALTFARPPIDKTLGTRLRLYSIDVIHKQLLKPFLKLDKVPFFWAIN